MVAIRWAAALLLLSAALAGCGGGGGGGGGGSSNGGGLSVGATAITFNMPSGGPPPGSQDVAVNVTNSAAAQVGAAYGPGVTPAAWLSIQVLGSAPNYTFRFSANPSGLAPGTYTTTVSIGIARSDGSIITHRDVGVTLTVGGTLSLSSTTMTFNHAVGGPAPTAQALTVSGNGAISWTASATANQPWLTLSATSGMTPSLITVGANPTGLAPGTYNATVTFTGGGDSKTLSVALVVSAPAIAPGQSQLTFTGVNGATLASQPLSIAINNGAASSWTASSSAPWLVLSASTGTTPQTIQIAVNPSIGPLASGVHNASVSLSATHAGNTLTSTVAVTLNLTSATLSADTTAIILGGSDGSDTAAATVRLSLNTGSNAYPWSVSGLATGAQVAPLSGTVSATPVTLTLQPLTTVVGNTYTSTATFSATINGDVVTRQVPMTVRIKPHRLFVHDTGVALMSSPTLSKLTESITVRENRSLPTTWTATSDQAWLTVQNGSGTTPGTFQLTADPSSLPVDTISYANVTVISTAPGVTNTEIVRVGLYRRATSPAAQTPITVPALQKPTGIVADPVRPYVYITHGTSVIEVYNIYTGALMQSIGGGSDLRSLAIDDEGSRLYAVDHGALGIRVVDIAASTPAIVATWTNARWSTCTSCGGVGVFADLDFTRVNGRGLLLAGGSEVIDASSGAVLVQSGGGFFAFNLAATISGDGSKIFGVGLGTSGHSVTRRTLAFDELNDNVSIGSSLMASKNGAGRGLSTDYSGSTAYRACWFDSQQIERYDGTTLATLSTVANGTNGGTIIGPDGTVYCARYYSDSSSVGWPSVWAVNASTGAVLSGRTYVVPDDLMERQFTISGDGLRLLTRSQVPASPVSGTLTITTLVP